MQSVIYMMTVNGVKVQ